jgi:hypothetical protein
VLDWQRDILPWLRATYALMDERGEDVLDWEDLGPRLMSERTDGELYKIFQVIKRAEYADVYFADRMSIAMVQPTEKGLQLTHGWPAPREERSDLRQEARLGLHVRPSSRRRHRAPVGRAKRREIGKLVP